MEVFQLLDFSTLLRLGTTTVYDNLVRSEKPFQTISEKRELRRKN